MSSMLDFAMHSHHEAQRLLPWLANGTLESAEREWMQEHLGNCAECRHGLQELQALQAAILEPGQVLPGVGAGMAARAVAHRVARRDAPAGRGIGFALEAGAALAGSGHRSAIAYGDRAWNRVVGHARATAGVPHLVWHAAFRGDLLVVFDPRISEAQLRRLLDASDARIVDGPTDAGAYVLSVSGPRGPRTRCCVPRGRHDGGEPCRGASAVMRPWLALLLLFACAARAQPVPDR